ncbi:MAG: Do family serine endopeptidase [Thermoguttaceae bacterium]
MQQSSWKQARFWFVALTLVALVGLIGAGSMAVGQKATAEPPLVNGGESAQHGAGYARTLSAAFRGAAGRVLPSVVMITVTPEVAQADQEDEMEVPQGFEDLPFGDMFKNQPELRRFFKELPRGRSHRFGSRGMGSGVIIDESGTILTNNHVVAGGGKITVRLHDGREFEAAEVKTDPKTDLAIVRLRGAQSLTAARLGDSDQAEVGDWVLALGQPFGLEGTVTAGIISAKGRGLGIADRESFLQTDASINPGNSGGPLVNLDGEVIGINTAISSNTGANQGVGFAVPVNLAKWVVEQLVQDGTVHRAYLGVLIQPVTQQLADQFGVKVNEGVVVTEVLPDSPAAQAGLKQGDVILSFNGKPVTSPNQLQGYVEQAKIGGQQSVVIKREGQEKTLAVVTREQPSKSELARKGSSRSDKLGSPSRVAKLGLEVETLTPEVAEQLELKAEQGVVITRVQPGSLADQAGIAQGMVITEVNRKSVKSAEDFQKILDEKALAKGVLLLVRTPSGSRYVVLRSNG